MGFNNSDLSGSQSIATRRSRFEETGTGRSFQFRETEANMRSVMRELEDVRCDPAPLESKLKKTGLSGYRRSSVEAYVDEMRRSANQLRDNMEQQIQSLSAECMRLKSESKVLRGQLLEAEEQTSQTRELLTAVTGERDAAEQRLSQSDAELRDAESRLRMLEAENSGLEDVRAQLRERSGQLECASAENERLRGQIQDFSRQIDQINDEIAKYRDRRSAESGELDCLRQETEELQRENGSLRRDAEELQRENGSLRRDAEALQRENGSLRQEADTLRRENETLRAELSRAKEELERLSALKADRARPQLPEPSVTYELSEEYRDSERESEMLRKKDQEQRASIEKLQSVIQGLFDEIQHQQDMYDRLTAERSENKGLIYNLTRDRSDLRVQNVDLQVQNMELMDKNEDLSKQVTKLAEENSRLSLIINQSPSGAIMPRKTGAVNPAEERIPDYMKRNGFKNYSR